MKKNISIFITISFVFFASLCSAAEPSQKRIIVVDSYHPEYLWSQHVTEGFSAALLKLGYLDNAEQVSSFAQNDYIEASGVIIKRLWMDTKRKTSKAEHALTTSNFAKTINEFKPDLIFLGDDNATNYIGNQYIDSNTPIVFWGVNNTPVKYGLVDSIKKPGHNVTGVFQKTYYRDSLLLLKKLVPHVQTFAILSDDTTTGRIHNKAIAHLARKDSLPLELVETVATNDYEEWQKKALELQTKVDAFFIASSNGLRDKKGKAITNEEAALWYTNHITIPEATGFRYRVEAGWLCAADDSGYNQGYEAVLIANDIFIHGADPASYPPRVPKRGPLMVNKTRAAQLNIPLLPEMGIEEFIETAKHSTKKKHRIVVIDSYHKEYAWSQDTQKGFSAAMLKLQYIDDTEQLAAFTQNDYIESSKAVIKKLWLDSKRNNGNAAQQEKGNLLYKIAMDFKPSIIFLGDDNAAQQLGPKLLDTEIPVVFWGLNNTPLKYGLVKEANQPGHNITGVYQTGHYIESFNLLKSLDPSIETFAILSDNSTTARANLKVVERLAQKGKLPMKLVETVVTGAYDIWQKKALELQKKVDALYLPQLSTLHDKNGKHVSTKEITKWYVTNITIPETMGGGIFLVEQGLLCVAYDSGYNQGYEALVIGHDILAKGKDPTTYPVRAPKRGPLTVNKQRAAMLGIKLTPEMGIEHYIEAASALEQ